ncbi:MAG: hypothetical protein ABI883_05305, partial [Chthoniobacterales bacterium]
MQPHATGRDFCGLERDKAGFVSMFPRVIHRVISVRYERGVYLPEQDLWLYPADPKPRAFVSHAHSDHIAAHQEVIV